MEYKDTSEYVNDVIIPENYITHEGLLIPNFDFINYTTEKEKKMKKSAIGLATVILMLFFAPMHSDAKTKANPLNLKKNKTEISAEAKAMITRLDEIKVMDFSKLSKLERKELRAEVKMMKSDLQAQQLNSSGGVYISVGAAIIIILLLILIL